ncbi:MAG: efflux RND transporter periplasmic adaptor subunit [Bacteroidetes bacterium]|nr:efflux RND transporter periplasmic adaptor subunit [Bacteroidota bacterium]
MIFANLIRIRNGNLFSRQVSLIVLFLSLIFIITLNINCSSKKDNGTTKNLTELDTVAVKVSKAKINNIRLIKTFTGTLEGEEQANIVSKIPERITEIKVQVGDNIKAGQLLIVLDKSGASSQFYQAQAGYLNAKKDLERMEALFKEGAISQQLFDGTKTAFEVARANFEAAKNTVELTSPIGGIVTAINNNVGELASPGLPLIIIANIQRMKIVFDVGEEDIPNLAIGQNSEVYSELKPELIQKGKISQISKSADIQSRSFELKTLFTNTSDKWFKPGMFCRVNVELKNKKNILTIPNAAVTVIQNTKGVFVINGHKASFRKIETGITDGIDTEILSGLKGGDVVVTLGTNDLKEGSPVYISEQTN